MATRIPIIDGTRCSGCGRCIAACHLRLFAFEQHGWRKISVLQDGDRCSGCNKCAGVCPIDAISMNERTPMHDLSLCGVEPIFKCLDACAPGF
jgi:ferredoxin